MDDLFANSSVQSPGKAMTNAMTPKAVKPTKEPKKPALSSSPAMTADRPPPDYVGRTINTSDPKHDGENLGSAGWIENGVLHSVHVTDSPHKVVGALKSHDITKHNTGQHEDLGPGLYASSVPHYWRGRAGDRWNFLDKITPEQTSKLADHAISKLHENVKTGYNSESEVKPQLSILNNIKTGKYPKTGFQFVAGQPFNIDLADKSTLEQHGITPGAEPKEQRIQAKGKFAELKRGTLSPEQQAELKDHGYHGAYVTGGMHGNPQIVLWDSDAIHHFGDYQHTPKGEAPKPSHVGSEHKFTKYNEHPQDWQIKVTHESENHYHAEDAYGQKQKFPKATFEHAMDDLKGSPPKSHEGAPHPAIAALAQGHGEHIGKGNDVVAWKVGDHIVKRTSPVPYHPLHHQIHDDIAKVNATAKKQAEMANHFHKHGIGAAPTEYYEHEGRGYLIQPALDTTAKMTPEQVGQVKQSLKQMHQSGHSFGDDIQAGIDKAGKPVLFDFGATGSKGKYGEEDDASAFNRFAEKQGVFDRMNDPLFDKSAEYGRPVKSPKELSEIHDMVPDIAFNRDGLDIDDAEDQAAWSFAKHGPFQGQRINEGGKRKGGLTPEYLQHIGLQEPSGQKRMFTADRSFIERFTAHWQRTLWDESAHPRETEPHDGKRPGEFAPKNTPSKPHAEPVKTPYKPESDNVGQSALDRTGLVLSNQGLARYWVKKYATQPTDHDDLFQEANIALIRASKDWDPTKSKFSTYASLWIKNAVARAASQLRRGQGEGGEEPAQDVSEHRSSPDRADQIDEVQRRMRRLTKDLRQVIEKVYGIGRPAQSVAQIAEESGQSRQYVNTLKNQALEEMRYTADQLASILRFDSTTLPATKRPSNEPLLPKPVMDKPMVTPKPQKPAPQPEGSILGGKVPTVGKMVGSTKPVFGSSKPPVGSTKPPSGSTKPPTAKVVQPSFNRSAGRPAPAGVPLTKQPTPQVKPPQPTGNPGQSVPSTYGEYLAAKRQTRFQDKQQDNQSRGNSSSHLLRAIQNVFPQRGTMHRAIGTLARASEAKTRNQLNAQQQQRAQRDQAFEQAYHANRQQAKEQSKSKSGDSQDSSGLGFSSSEVNQMRQLGLDDNAIKSMWAERTGQPQPQQSNQPRRMQIRNPKAPQSAPAPTPVVQTPQPTTAETPKPTEPEDKTGLGHDPELSPYDDRHEFLLPDQAKKYQDEADQYWKAYQESGSEEDAAKAASRVRQLKLHGYAHNLPHSKQGIIDRHQKQQVASQNKNLIRQWTQMQQQLSQNPDDTFAQAALTNIEKHLQKHNIDAEKSVKESSQRKLNKDFEAFRSALQNASPTMQDGTFRDANITPGTNEQKAANREVERLSKAFEQRGIPHEQLLQKAHGKEKWDGILKQREESRRKKEDETRQYQERLAREKEFRTKLTAPVAAPKLPPMQHATHHSPEERQESEAIRDKMVEASKEASKPDDLNRQKKALRSQRTQLAKDPLYQWRGHKVTARRPIDKAIIEATGTDDHIVHQIIHKEMERQGDGANIEARRNEAVRELVQNFVPKATFPSFMKEVRNAQDPDHIKGFDMIVEMAKNTPALNEALIGSGKGNLSIEDAVFQSLKSGMSNDTNSLRKRVERTIEWMGGHKAIQGILDHYNPPERQPGEDDIDDEETMNTIHDDDNPIPFSVPSSMVDRFSSAWWFQQAFQPQSQMSLTDRFSLSWMQSAVQRFGSNYLFDDEFMKGRSVGKKATRNWRNMQTKVSEGRETIRAPKGGAYDIVTGKFREGGKLISKPRFGIGQKVLGLEHDEPYHKSSTARLKQLAANGDAEAAKVLNERLEHEKSLPPQEPAKRLGSKGQVLIDFGHQEMAKAPKRLEMPPEKAKTSNKITGRSGHQKAMEFANQTQQETGAKPSVVKEDSITQAKPESAVATQPSHDDSINRVSAMADRHESYARQTEGGKGLAVGSGNIDDRWKADSLRQMIRDIQSGISTDEAATKAKAAAREWIAKHNSRRPKDINWARWDGAVDSTIDTAARMLKQSTSESKPITKDTGLTGSAPETVRSQSKTPADSLHQKTLEDVIGSAKPVHDSVGDLLQKLHQATEDPNSKRMTEGSRYIDSDHVGISQSAARELQKRGLAFTAIGKTTPTFGEGINITEPGKPFSFLALSDKGRKELERFNQAKEHGSAITDAVKTEQEIPSRVLRSSKTAAEAIQNYQPTGKTSADFGDVVQTSTGVRGIVQGSGGMGSTRRTVVDPVTGESKGWFELNDLTPIGPKRNIDQKTLDELNKVAVEAGLEPTTESKSTPLIRHALDRKKNSIFSPKFANTKFIPNDASIVMDAFKGADAIWFHQGDTQHLVWNAEDKDASENIKQKAAELAAARDAGYQKVNHRAGKYGTVWVMEKDGKILTKRGAEALVKGSGSISLPPASRESIGPHLKAVNDFIKSLPESTQQNFGALVTAFNRSPLAKYVVLERGQHGELRLRDAVSGDWRVHEPSSGHQGDKFHKDLESSLPRFLAKIEYMANNEIPQGYGEWASHDRAADSHAVSVVPPQGAEPKTPNQSQEAEDQSESPTEAVDKKTLDELNQVATESGLEPAKVEDVPKSSRPKGAFSLAHAAHDSDAIEQHATADEIKQWFNESVQHADNIRSELGKKTVDQLKRMGAGGWYANSMKKAELVDDLVKKIQNQYNIDGSVSYVLTGRKGEHEEAVRKAVESLTDEKLSNWREDRKKSQEQKQQERAAAAQAVADPKTLDDYRKLINAVGGWKHLKPEQQAAFDDLYARDRRAKDKEQKATVTANVSQDHGGFTLTKNFHSKRGQDIFTASPANRVERDEYNAMNATAKKLGGWYYKQFGSTPGGFHFPTEEARNKFVEAMSGKAVDRSDVLGQRHDEKLQTTSGRLHDLANRMEESADSSLGQTRQTNTARRAGMAASAESDARRKKAHAQTIRRIAQHLESNPDSHLAGIGAGTHIDELNKALRSSKYTRFQKMSPSEQESHRKGGNTAYESYMEQPENEDDIHHVEYPFPSIWTHELRDISGMLKDEPGFKKLATAIGKLGSIEPDAKKQGNGIKFDKADTFDPAQFAKEVGGGSIIKSLIPEGHHVRVHLSTDRKLTSQHGPGPFYTADAGKTWSNSAKGAVVAALTSKNAKGAFGKNLDSIRPVEDRRVPIKDSEFIDSISRASVKLKASPYPNLKRIGSNLADRIESYKRMRLADIKNTHELRAALREYLPLKQNAEKEDPVKKAERDLVGRKFEGFFPTPRSIIDQMLDHADIQPGHSVLEPSAGKGDILDAILERHKDDGINASAIEIQPALRKILELKGHSIIDHDFTSHQGEYDRIVMNPPFEKNQDIDHVRKAHSMLKPGGNVVAVMAGGGGKKREEFDTWVYEQGGEIIPLEAGSFSGSDAFRQTGVNTKLAIIPKASVSKNSIQSTALVDRFSYAFIAHRYGLLTT